MTSRQRRSTAASGGLAWRAAAVALWLLALAMATGGLGLARRVLDRGVAYGDEGAVLPRDVTLRSVNVQLEMEPDDAAVARTLDMVRDAGFGWIRQQVSWADLEPGHKGNFWAGERGQPTWARIDTIAREASARGIRVIARVELPPEWARPPGTFRSHPPINVRDYADILAAFTSRYRGVIDYVQVWNEPNLAEEWGRRPVDAAAYVELLRAGYEGARRGNPKVVVVAASLAQTLEPDLETAAGLDDLAYLDRMYAFGAAPFFDVAAANGYGLWTGPDDRQVGADYTNLSRPLLVRDVMARHGDAAKPLWISEFGWNAEPPDWAGRPSPWGRVDEATQAAWLQRAWHRAEREWSWVGPMSVWLMRQPRPVADDPTQFFALVGADWRAGRAYDALVAERQHPVLGPGTWPDGARGIEYVGTWQVSAGARGSLRETPAPNAHVRLRFEGTRIAILAPVGPERGVAYVTIDGSYVLAGALPRNRFGQAMIDFGAPNPIDSVRFPVASGLPDGVHTLELTVSGDAGTGSSAPGVGIDGVVIARDRSTAPETILGIVGVASVVAGAWSLRSAPRVQRAGFHTPQAPARRIVETGRENPRGASGEDAGHAFFRAWLTWPVFMTVLALPLASSSALAVPTPIGRFSPVELVALVAIGAGALAAFFGADPIRGRWRSSQQARDAYRAVMPPRLADLEPEQWGALLLAVGGTVGAIIATNPTPAWREWRLLVAEPVAWFVVARSVVRDATRARWLTLALVLGASVAGLVAIVQAVTGVGVVDAEGVGRAVAFSPSPNNLALLLGRIVPLAVALALSCAPARITPHAPTRLILGSRAAAWSAVALVGGGLAVTWSRGGWIAGAVACAWVVWQVRRDRSPTAAPPTSGRTSPTLNPSAPSKRGASTGEGLCGVAARAIVTPHAPAIHTLAQQAGALPVVGGFMRWRSRALAVGAIAALAGLALTLAPVRVRSVLDADGSGLLRLSVWESAVAMIWDHPWFGIGLDQFVYAYPQYLQASAWREPNLSHPHQFILDAWLRLGAFGLLAIVALWWGVWSRNRRAVHVTSLSRADRTLRHGATAALLAIVGHGLVDNSYFVVDLAYATWAIVLIHRGASLPTRDAPSTYAP